MRTETAIIKGSLQALANRENMSLAETFMQAEIIILLDYSGSMLTHDADGGRKRIDVAKEELANLQNQMPGKIALVCFADIAMWSPAGVPVEVGALTNLTGALNYIKRADSESAKFIVISDGEPNNTTTALRAAKTFLGRIDTVYVGPEDGYGKEFLLKLAKEAGGEHIDSELCKKLSSGIIKLLGTGEKHGA